ncbi:aldehyde dehydrogenase family protein [Peptoniphilus sp. KCTC 25270]|uniref:aldehyde dehydrogenase family protein n=1 Tax=Peptoniphilus sp. KCTC 25270 TaxID=2897414 RepID=UPI001E63B6E4|nr:aldehyde dehydrogenase family protein [Peptoniphilus sp. KCTC 25270]MCD1147754.1 aldehyde dehydrogenase family protein [Peptoniphilus sp. KCTC 25270]
MEYTSFDEMERLFFRSKGFFASGKTRSFSYRKKQLFSLLQGIEAHKLEIYEALKADLNKSEWESFLTEVYLVKDEIRHMIRHLSSYGRRKKLLPGLAQIPGRLEIRKEPFGSVLIVSPWNYPFQLAMVPIVGAIAAGNSVIVKPSEFSPRVSLVLAKICEEALDPGLVSFVFGEAKEAEHLLSLPFDKIFFTGNPSVGKVVMERASQNLTPVTLELGGKSPAILHSSADVKESAKRIAFGKSMNAGQTCIAPDYVLLPREILADFIGEILLWFEEFFPSDTYFREYFGRMNHQGRFDRMLALAEGQSIRSLHDQIFYEESLQVFPCVVENPSWDSQIMKEEIFGPLLPVLPYDSEEELFDLFRDKEKPLALYLFGKDRNFFEEAMNRIDSGGVCINDTLLHISSSKAPFGGVGNSGMGQYHGKYSFEAFSRERTVLRKSWIFDVDVRYHPFG